MSDGLTRFFWVRHAPVKAMIAGRIYGQRDVGCDVRDEAALLKTANALPQDAIWVTSKLSRTKKTAYALAKQRGWHVKLLPYKELMEQNFGLWQSQTWDDLNDDPTAHAFWQDPVGHCPPDGESYQAMCQRVQNCIRHLCKKYQGQDLVCVAHAGTIRAALAMALDLDLEKSLRLNVETLSVSRLEYFQQGDDTGSWSVRI